MTMKPPAKAAAHTKPVGPKIVLINQAKSRFGFEPAKLVPALQLFVDRYFAPAWGIGCTLSWKGARTPAGAWELILRDDSDEADAEAYHDRTDEGQPRSIVFLRTTMAEHDLPSVAASHELVEMLANPWLNLGYQRGDGAWVSGETADPVQGSFFKVAGLAMSNFVHPAWFDAESKRPPGSFDSMGVCARPFQIAAGGYCAVFHKGRWGSEYGHAARRAVTDRERLRHKQIIARPTCSV